MGKKSRYFLLFKGESVYKDKYDVIEGDRENKTLIILHNVPEAAFGGYENPKTPCEEEEIPSEIFDMFYRKIKGTGVKKVNVCKYKKPKELISFISYKKNKVYQLIIDLNNYTYELKNYKENEKSESSIILEDFVFDLLVESLVEARYLSYDKKVPSDIVFEAINGNFSCEMLQSLYKYKFEEADYYSYELLVNQIKKYFNEEMDFNYYINWCNVVSKALLYTNKYYDQHRSVFGAISALFYKGGFYEDKEDEAILAKLKYLDFKLFHSDEEFIKDGIVRYIILSSYGDGYNALIIDTNNKVYNSLKDVKLKFDENKNYTFIGLESSYCDEGECYIDYGDEPEYNEFEIYVKMFKLISKNIYVEDKKLF